MLGWCSHLFRSNYQNKTESFVIMAYMNFCIFVNCATYSFSYIIYIDVDMFDRQNILKKKSQRNQSTMSDYGLKLHVDNQPTIICFMECYYTRIVARTPMFVFLLTTFGYLPCHSVAQMLECPPRCGFTTR